jgi:hypothetical protein
MCCNRIQQAEKCQIKPRTPTESIMKAHGLTFAGEFIFYLKSCCVCRGSRITVFAEDICGILYFIERIKSRNVHDFLKKNAVIKQFKSKKICLKSAKYIPLRYYDNGKKLKCLVNYSSIKSALYDPDIYADLMLIKENTLSIL